MPRLEHRMLHTAQLKSAGYDEKEKLLEIAFHNGQLKTYKGVPQEVARRLFAAPNPASFWEDRIAEEYPVESGRAGPDTGTAARLDDLFGKP
ncbi:MAG TPA: KTSC domain-containing protein [Lautropia sp.]|nr:KTSC domain-containing protein [Lautropia sp.]